MLPAHLLYTVYIIEAEFVTGFEINCGASLHVEEAFSSCLE